MNIELLNLRAKVHTVLTLKVTVFLLQAFSIAVEMLVVVCLVVVMVEVCLEMEDCLVEVEL